jgi:uncharacterized protein YceK
MARAVVAVSLALMAVTLSGCGTFSDALCGPIDPNPFYRGVRFDIGAAKGGGGNVFLLADLPFSAVADTVLLPYATFAFVVQRVLDVDIPDSAEDGKPSKAPTTAPSSQDGPPVLPY